MNILQNDYVLKSLDLPRIEWKQYFTDTEFAQNILWSIKVEEIPKPGVNKKLEPVKKKFLLPFYRKKDKQKEVHGLIGVDAKTAKEFAKKHQKHLNAYREIILYYPYYTVVKSGILDINRTRIVIEGTAGDIKNLTTNHQVQVTMIFTEDDMSIVGDEAFFQQNEVLPLIDYGREIRKMTAQDMEQGKNIQLSFSYVYRTSEVLKPEGELQLIFYQFRLF